jgi:hypothetical protein
VRRVGGRHEQGQVAGGSTCLVTGVDKSRQDGESEREGSK